MPKTSVHVNHWVRPTKLRIEVVIGALSSWVDLPVDSGVPVALGAAEALVSEILNHAPAERGRPAKATEQHQPFVITFAKTGIRNGYVTVWAYNEDIARAWAHQEYGQLWSGIYEASVAGLELYPAGELGVEVLFYEDARHI